MKKRVYQILVSSGLIGSRKEAEELLKQGRITVDHKPIKTLEYFIDRKKQLLMLDNQIVKPKKEKIYILFNKPKGVETTKQDILKFINIDEILKKTIFPVGRLDKNSEGLIILTNDGLLSEKILRPEVGVKKTYQVVVEKELSKEDLKDIEKGIEIEMENNNNFFKYKTKPAKIEKVVNKTYEIKIIEGKKRQIRRMLEAMNNKVLELKRVSIGKIKLGNLKPGEYKIVSREDIY